MRSVERCAAGAGVRPARPAAGRAARVDVTRLPATVRLCGTIVSPAGMPTHRRSHPKTMKSTRTVSVPSFAAEMLRARLVATASDAPGSPDLLQPQHGTPFTTNNIRRRLRAVLEEAGIEGVTPHSFRRTVATVLDRAGERTWRPRCSATGSEPRDGRDPRAARASPFEDER